MRLRSIFTDAEPPKPTAQDWSHFAPLGPDEYIWWPATRDYSRGSLKDEAFLLGLCRKDWYAPVQVTSDWEG